MAEQALTHELLMNSIHLVAMMAVSEIARELNADPTDTLLQFMQSPAARALYDPETAFWCEGPSAVAAEYMRERKEHL